MGSPFAPRHEHPSELHSNAAINWAPDDWFSYSLGFKEATDILLENVLANERFHDALVYPILLLIHQFTEVRLKGLICRVNRKRTLPKKLHTHDLYRLWKELRQIINTSTSDEDQRYLDETEKLIEQVSQIDRTSTEFRYPFNSENKKSLVVLGNIVNMKRVSDFWVDLSNRLENIHGQIDYLLTESKP